MCPYGLLVGEVRLFFEPVADNLHSLLFKDSDSRYRDGGLGFGRTTLHKNCLCAFDQALADVILIHSFVLSWLRDKLIDIWH